MSATSECVRRDGGDCSFLFTPHIYRHCISSCFGARFIDFHWLVRTLQSSNFSTWKKGAIPTHLCLIRMSLRTLSSPRPFAQLPKSRSPKLTQSSPTRINRNLRNIYRISNPSGPLSTCQADLFLPCLLSCHQTCWIFIYLLQNSLCCSCFRLTSRAQRALSSWRILFQTFVFTFAFLTLKLKCHRAVDHG